MKTRPRILFLCHSASRNGATILLLHLLRSLKAKVDWDIVVLVEGRGPLLVEIRALAPTIVWRSPASLLRAFTARRTADLFSQLEMRFLRALLTGRRFDLIYANTVATWPLVRALASRAPSVLWHIHELTYALRLSTSEQKIGELFHARSRFVAVSDSVRDALLREFNLSADMVEVVNGFIPATHVGPEEQRSQRERTRRQLGWPADVFVVGGCGTLGWRKGTDLFLQIARAVSNAKGYENVRFLWVGGGAEDRESLEFTYDLRALGLEGHCCRVPTTADVFHYYSAMDVLALTSREDPFPLVMLEAGSYRVPVVCFADSGGGPEFVGEDAGLVAPYLDITGFAAHLMRLRNEPGLLESLGATALAKVQTRYRVDVQVPKLLKIIENCLSMPDPRRLIGPARARERYEDSP